MTTVAETFELAPIPTLEECEAVIQRGVDTWVEAGNALTTIRDHDLYRNGYDTFDDYCLKRWGWTASRSRQLIGSAKVVTNLKRPSTAPKSVTIVTLSDLPATESQARPLVSLTPEDQVTAWVQANQTAKREGAKVTARHVEVAAKEVREQTPPKASGNWKPPLPGYDAQQAVASFLDGPDPENDAENGESGLASREEILEALEMLGDWLKEGCVPQSRRERANVIVRLEEAIAWIRRGG